MYVIMSSDRRCIVKGKARKCLCTVDEPTRKELVAYDTPQKAQSALMRMYVLQSEQATALYGGSLPRLDVVETE